MAKGKREKDKQSNGQRKTTKRKTIYWPKKNEKRTNNIKANGKRQRDKQYKDHRKTTKDKQYNG
jgi:hypothetical protein